jgi:hypothetical protein
VQVEGAELIRRIANDGRLARGIKKAEIVDAITDLLGDCRYEDGLHPVTGTMQEMVDRWAEEAEIIYATDARESAAEFHQGLRDELPKLVEKKIAKARGLLNKFFTDRVIEASDPLNGLSWASEYFMEAARVEVWGQVLARLTKETPATPSEVLEQLTDDVMREARQSTHGSTSPTSNIADEARRMATAEVLDDWEMRGAAKAPSMPRSVA